MEAHQEARLKEAEAADAKKAANRDTFAEPTGSIIDMQRCEVQGKYTYLAVH
jgi:hypothetical protein